MVLHLNVPAQQRLKNLLRSSLHVRKNSSRFSSAHAHRSWVPFLFFVSKTIGHLGSSQEISTFFCAQSYLHYFNATYMHSNKF